MCPTIEAMDTRRRTAVTLLVVALAALPACRSDDVATPTATLQRTPPSPSPSPSAVSTPTEAPFEVPATIDEAYVERVLERLYVTEGDVARLSLEAGGVTSEVEALIRAVAAPEWAEALLEEARREAGAGFPTLRRPPGNATFILERLVTGRPDCIYVVGLKDYSQVTDPPVDRTGERDFVWLIPAEPTTANPTGWVVGAMRTRTDGADEADPCA